MIFQVTFMPNMVRFLYIVNYIHQWNIIFINPHVSFYSETWFTHVITNNTNYYEDEVAKKDYKFLEFGSSFMIWYG